MGSVVGTLVSDNLVDNFGVALQTTTIAFSIALAVTFSAWYANEKTLSIHKIFTTRREIFYIFTRRLGASFGDLLSQPREYGGLGFGTAVTSLLFLGAIVLIVIYMAFSRHRDEEDRLVTGWIGRDKRRSFSSASILRGRAGHENIECTQCRTTASSPDV